MAATTKTIPFSGNDEIDTLIANFDSSSSIIWSTSTGVLTFSFPTSASFYNYSGVSFDESAHDFQAFTSSLQDAARKILGIYSQYINLKFSEVTETSSAHADLRLAVASPLDNNAKGTGYFPGDAVKSGDVWLSGAVANFDPQFFGIWTPSQNGLGGRGFTGLMHEIGHALGLAHPLLDPSHDGYDYTIMDPTVAVLGILDSAANAQSPETPMLDDVAALQYMYGANFNTNAFNTTYKWDPTTGEMFINGSGQGAPTDHKIYMTLWDGGGNDTYDFSNYTTNVIADLRPGEFSTPSADQIADFNIQPPGFNTTLKATGSIANPFLYNNDPRSLIENANGGTGNDTLIGNQANNVLNGNAGDDTFFYADGGVDTFNGGTKGTSGDTADFSLFTSGVTVTPVATTTTLRLPNGQTFTFVISETLASSDAGAHAYDVSYFTELGPIHIVNLTGMENITGSAFADTITGNVDNNVIKAGAGNDHVFYTGGVDTISGGQGTDTIDFSAFGSAVWATLASLGLFPEAVTTGTSSVFDGSPFQTIAQLSGFENAVGTQFADSLVGNSGDNKLDGGAGDDTLFYDGSGIDTLIGNTGTDTADFSPSSTAVSVDLTGLLGFEARGNGTTDATTGPLIIGLAHLTSIENITGTSFKDIIRGDGNANVINGGDGADTLGGRGGSDTINGGAGNDTYEFVGSSLGSDKFFDESGTADKIVIDNLSNLTGALRDGDDLIIKFSNGGFRIIDHFLAGHAIENLQDNSRGVVLATSSIGGSGSGIIAGTDGNDALDGRGGDDLLYGNDGNDHLLGGTGNDLLDAGNGNDILDGGPGDDTMIGGAGRDVFAFSPGDDAGNDVILDFQTKPAAAGGAGGDAAAGAPDVIDLRDFQTSFRALDNNRDGVLEQGERDGRITIQIDGSDTVLAFAEGSIRVSGVATMHSYDFMF